MQAALVLLYFAFSALVAPTSALDLGAYQIFTQTKALLQMLVRGEPAFDSSDFKIYNYGCNWSKTTFPSYGSGEVQLQVINYDGTIDCPGFGTFTTRRCMSGGCAFEEPMRDALRKLVAKRPEVKNELRSQIDASEYIDPQTKRKYLEAIGN